MRSFWDLDEVSAFLGATPECPHGDPDLVTLLHFPVGDAVALLLVRPADRSAQLEVRREGSEPFITAGLECQRIYVQREIPEEGGDSLILAAPGSHIAISRTNESFTIFLGLHGKDAKGPA